MSRRGGRHASWDGNWASCFAVHRERQDPDHIMMNAFISEMNAEALALLLDW